MGGKKASANDEIFKSAASELLCVCVLLKFFLHQVIPAGAVVAERASFESLYRVVKLAELVKAHSSCNLEDLAAMDREIQRYRSLHAAAYGTDYVRPKHHYLHHVTDQPRKDRFWLDCFVHERKHKVVKACMESFSRHASIEQSTLERLWQVITAEMDGAFPSQLMDPVKEADLQGNRVMISRAMRYHGLPIAKGDIALIGAKGFLAQAALFANGVLALLAEPLTPVMPQRHGASSSRWRRNGGVLCVQSPDGAKVAPAWFANSDGDLTVLA